MGLPNRVIILILIFSSLLFSSSKIYSQDPSALFSSNSLISTQQYCPCLNNIYLDNSKSTITNPQNDIHNLLSNDLIHEELKQLLIFYSTLTETILSLSIYSLSMYYWNIDTDILIFFLYYLNFIISPNLSLSPEDYNIPNILHHGLSIGVTTSFYIQSLKLSQLLYYQHGDINPTLPSVILTQAALILSIINWMYEYSYETCSNLHTAAQTLNILSKTLQYATLHMIQHSPNLGILDFSQ